MFRSLSSQVSLEAIDLQASEIARAGLLDLQSFIKQIDKIDLAGISNADLTPLNDCVNKFTHTVKAVSFALSIRVYCSALCASYMEDDLVRIARLDDVDAFAKSLNEVSVEFQKAARNKIETLTEIFSFKETIELKKQNAKTEIANAVKAAAELVNGTSREVAAIRGEERLLKGGETPIELIVTVDRGGRLIGAQVAGKSVF
jgi:uncharacterized radical SAM superfamily Fe-S cluster-containing enzyme